MKNYLQPGEVLTFTAPADLTAGTPYLLGSLLVVPTHDAASGSPCSAYCRGVFSGPKTDSQAWTLGVKVYWDNTNSCFTTVATSNTLVGVAAEAVASTAGLTTGKVRLDGVAR